MKSGTTLDFDALVESYYQPVFTFAVKLCGRLDGALELTQHTFCLALNRQRSFGKQKNAKPLLFNLLFREFLKEKWRVGASTRSVLSRRRVSNQAASSPILTALTKVRKELQAPLILFYAKDFSLSQIAECLGISFAAALKLLSQGREEMSTALASSVARVALHSSAGAKHRGTLPLAA